MSAAEWGGDRDMKLVEGESRGYDQITILAFGEYRST